MRHTSFSLTLLLCTARTADPTSPAPVTKSRHRSAVCTAEIIQSRHDDTSSLPVSIVVEDGDLVNVDKDTGNTAGPVLSFKGKPKSYQIDVKRRNDHNSERVAKDSLCFCCCQVGQPYPLCYLWQGLNKASSQYSFLS